MVSVLYWYNAKKKISIPLVNASLRFIRPDRIIETTIDTIVNNETNEPVDINIFHLAKVEMRGHAGAWRNSDDYYTRLFHDIYKGTKLEDNVLHMPKMVGFDRSTYLDELKPYILDLPERLPQSRWMPIESDGEVRPYSSFRVNLPPKQLTTFRVSFIIKDESYLYFVNEPVGSSCKIYALEESWIETKLKMHTKNSEQKAAYLDFYMRFVRDSIVIPHHYNMVVVDYKTNPEIGPLIYREENYCLKPDRELSRNFGVPGEPDMHCYFLQIIDPATFRLKLFVVER